VVGGFLLGVATFILPSACELRALKGRVLWLLCLNLSVIPNFGLGWIGGRIWRVGGDGIQNMAAWDGWEMSWERSDAIDGMGSSVYR